MRKTALVLVLVLLVTLFAIPVSAAESRMSSVVPGLTISGGTAHCSCTITGDTTSDYITGTFRLWLSGVCVATWSSSGYGYLFWSQSHPAATGQQYTLTADVVVAGVAFPTASVSAR